MTRLMLAVAFAAIALPTLAQDKVVEFSSSDPEMNAAIASARSTLPEFWDTFAAPAPNEADFSLKLGISDGVTTEHFWCSQVEGTATSATCTIANEPVDVHTVSYGERIEVDPAIISDWMYQRDGKIVGAETLRVMLPHLPAAEADNLRAMLAD